MLGFNPFTLEGKVFLVTGASSGIGRGIAVTCSKMGATIIINGRNIAKLQETSSQMAPDKAIIKPGDLAETATLSALVSELPKLDGVVHCAGMGQRIPCKDLQIDNVNQVMDVNFKAPVMLQAELLRQKKMNKSASIVFVASIASWSPSFGNSIYSASKGAIISYANCLALELAPRKIRVNCISPAMVWTDLVLADGTDVEQLKEDELTYPLKRYGQPEDIANLVVYMLSDASTWMTGSNVNITGGGHFVVRK
jgi:NAD(P)-dependent dehydrogenase (short-subunit alcohol dehydrogenase family)